MESELPDWAIAEAAALRGAVVWQSNAANQIIARALVAAERRGVERAADHLDALAKNTPLGHEQPTRGASTYNWFTHCAAAIRQLGEEP